VITKKTEFCIYHAEVYGILCQKRSIVMQIDDFSPSPSSSKSSPIDIELGFGETTSRNGSTRVWNLLQGSLSSEILVNRGAQGGVSAAREPVNNFEYRLLVNVNEAPNLLIDDSFEHKSRVSGPSVQIVGACRTWACNDDTGLMVIVNTSIARLRNSCSTYLSSRCLWARRTNVCK